MNPHKRKKYEKIEILKKLLEASTQEQTPIEEAPVVETPTVEQQNIETVVEEVKISKKKKVV